MNKKVLGLTTLLAICSAVPYSNGQYAAPASVPPYPGLLNSTLRQSNTALSAWDFGVNIRFRDENRDNAGTTDAGSNWDFSKRPVDDNQNDYEILRVMPRVGYSVPGLSFLVEGRSSYSFGDERYNATAPGKALADDDGTIDFYQAYVQIGDLKQGPLQFKVGRQELNYGDQRILGSAKWLNNPRTFDAVKGTYKTDDISVDLFASSVVYIRNNHLNESNFQDALYGVYVTLPKVSSKETVETYLYSHNVARGISTDDWSQVAAPLRFPGAQDIYTAGVRVKSKPKAYGQIDYTVEGMYQFGNRTAVFPGSTVAAALTAPRLEQSAYALVAQLGYTLADQWAKPRVAVIYSYASGDKNPNDSMSQTFQNLFPSNHSLYGNMDMTGLQNMQDLRLSYSIKPLPTLSIALDAHLQYLANTNDFWYNAAGAPRNVATVAVGSGKGYRINPSYSNELGQELDLTAGWSATKYALLEIGVSHFFRGDYVKQSLSAVGSRDGNYVFVQATLNL
jgi:hypothetical protein